MTRERVLLTALIVVAALFVGASILFAVYLKAVL